MIIRSLAKDPALLPGLILLICLSIISCRDTSVNTTEDQGYQIHGKIINWNTSYRDSLFWEIPVDSATFVLASTRINSLGEFEISLNNPPSELLNEYNRFENTDGTVIKFYDNISFSDPHARYTKFFLIHKDRISLSIQCGNTGKLDWNSSPGDYLIYYYYFDRPVVVTGEWKVVYQEEVPPGYSNQIITRSFRR